MSKRKKLFLPHDHVQSSGLKLTAVRVDGKTLDLDGCLDSEDRVLSLADQVDGEAEVEIDVRVDLPGRAARTLAPEETFSKDARVTLVLASGASTGHASQGRISCCLNAVDGGFSGSIRFRSTDVIDIGELECVVSRAADGAAETGGAERLGARLVTLRSWTIRLVEPRLAPGGLLDVKWADFAETRPTRVDCLFLLDLDVSPPILWLNSGISDFEPLLHGSGRRGPAARSRELVTRSIAAHVWLQLSFAAVLGSRMEDGSPDDEGGNTIDWTASWHEAVVTQVARIAYPRLGAGARIHALLNDVNAAHEDRSFAALLTTLANASLDHSELTSAVRGAIKELHTGDRS